MRNAWFVFVITLGIVVALAACGPKLRDELDQSLNRYGDLFRWNELDATSLFAADSLRPDFIVRTKAAKNVKVIDYRIIGARYDGKKRKASVEVEIDYYLVSSATVKTLRDTEEWAYREERGVKGWRLMSLLPEFR
jgi:hypothetical protein